MGVRTYLMAILALVGLSLPVYSQTTLEWKFKVGEKYFVEETQDMKQTVSVIGKDIKQTVKTTTITSYTVKNIDGNGVTLEMKFESIQAKSEGDMPADGLDKLQDKMVGATFTLTLDKGKLTRFQGFKDFVKRLTDEDEEVGKVLKMFLTEETLKKGIEANFTLLPTTPVKKGDTWKREQNIPLGPLGNLKATNDYTFQGQEQDGAVVSFKGTMAFVPPTKDGGGEALFKVVKSNLKSDDARGSFVFDVEKGRMVRNSTSMTVRGSMTIEVMNNELEMEMSMELSTKSRVLSKNPKVN